MKVGFPTNPRKNLIEDIKWIGENGFDFVDLFLEEDQAVPEKIDIEKIKSVLKEYKLDVIGHTAWYLPVGSPIKSIREAAVAEAVKYFKIFSKVGTKFVTIHTNWPGGMFSAEEGINFQVESLKKLSEEAKRYGIMLMLEPIDTVEDSVKNVSKILKRVPSLYFHLDIGHANLFGRKPEQFIRIFHRKLKHVHLHDNKRDKDSHLPMGCGTIDWKRVLKTLKKHYDGTITLEIFSNDRRFVLISKQKLQELWERI